MVRVVSLVNSWEGSFVGFYEGAYEGSFVGALVGPLVVSNREAFWKFGEGVSAADQGTLEGA